MERKNIKEMPQFILSQDEKVALIEAKIARTQAHICSLVALAEKLEATRRSKYPSR